VLCSRQLLAVEEDGIMTIQVGLIGNGGIVLASDRRITANDVKVGEELVGYAAYIGKLETKIEFSQEKNIAISCADNFIFAQKVAKQIIAELKADDLVDEYSASREIERIVRVASSKEGKRAQWLIALKCPDWHLLKCLLAPREVAREGVVIVRINKQPTGTNEQLDASAIPNGEWDISCAPCRSWDFAGEITNPAISWHKYHDEDLSPKQLIPLAAHLIFSAHFFNSKGVDGLDIVQCDASGVRLLSTTSIATLQKKSRMLDGNIKEYLFNDKQEYTYAPQEAEA
jgi:hypothetical protein